MGSFERLKEENQIKHIFGIKGEQEYWINIFQGVYDGKIDIWDYQWMYTVLARNGLSVLSNTNLISNIGFDIESTHMRGNNNIFSNIEVKDV